MNLSAYRVFKGYRIEKTEKIQVKKTLTQFFLFLGLCNANYTSESQGATNSKFWDDPVRKIRVQT